MPNATFARPDLTTFARLDELGLEVTGQYLEPGRAVLACRVVEPDGWCRPDSCHVSHPVRASRISRACGVGGSSAMSSCPLMLIVMVRNGLRVWMIFLRLSPLAAVR